MVSTHPQGPPSVAQENRNKSSRTTTMESKEQQQLSKSSKELFDFVDPWLDVPEIPQASQTQTGLLYPSLESNMQATYLGAPRASSLAQPPQHSDPNHQTPGTHQDRRAHELQRRRERHQARKSRQVQQAQKALQSHQNTLSHPLDVPQQPLHSLQYIQPLQQNQPLQQSPAPQQLQLPQPQPLEQPQSPQQLQLPPNPQYDHCLSGIPESIRHKIYHFALKHQGTYRLGYNRMYDIANDRLRPCTHPSLFHVNREARELVHRHHGHYEAIQGGQWTLFRVWVPHQVDMLYLPSLAWENINSYISPLRNVRTLAVDAEICRDRGFGTLGFNLMKFLKRESSSFIQELRIVLTTVVCPEPAWLFDSEGSDTVVLSLKDHRLIPTLDAVYAAHSPFYGGTLLPESGPAKLLSDLRLVIALDAQSLTLATQAGEQILTPASAWNELERAFMLANRLPHGYDGRSKAEKLEVFDNGTVSWDWVNKPTPHDDKMHFAVTTDYAIAFYRGDMLPQRRRGPSPNYPFDHGRMKYVFEEIGR
ncbi:hypothetical protein F5Y15DRAFT_256026 [Xylariaceae sp. FL0016]|nr:hypothetical protein F5Y15DRAFT_256026 [Xylariaceae sp. FL0016]